MHSSDFIIFLIKTDVRFILLINPFTPDKALLLYQSIYNQWEVASRKKKHKKKKLKI